MDNGFKVRKGLSLENQPSQPANGANGDIYYDSALGSFQGYASGAWGPLGSGMGGAGINIIGLNSNFQPVNTNDINAEGTIGNWAAYADAPADTPVDMTGGSPVVTISRTTTPGEVLNGLGSFKVVKDAANRQGNGVSVLTNNPVGYRGAPLTIMMPFKIISGTLVQGDLKMFIYDVTNSVVVTPTNNDVVSGFNLLTATFDNLSPSCTQFRFGFHFASTSTTAVTFTFDDVFVGISNVSLGLSKNDAQPFVMQIDGSVSNPTKGTTSVDAAYWERDGDHMIISWTYIQTGAGSAGSGTYLFKLPQNTQIDTNKTHISTDGNLATVIGVGDFNNSTDKRIGLLVMPYDATHLFAKYGSSGDYGSPANVLSDAVPLSGTNWRLSFTVRVPILGWSVNVAQGTSSVFKISTVLASGTNVTATPAKLGEYRTYQKNASATTGVDNAPSAPPNILDGMRIYSQPFGSAGVSGQTNRWEIFVGKNKSVSMQTYASAARTGWLNTDVVVRNAGEQNGLHNSYDPTTGVYIVDTIEQNSGTTNNFVGEAQATGGAGASFPTDGYFDLVVSENVIPVQLTQKRVLISPEATISAGGSGNISNFDLTMTGVKPNTILEVSVQPNINSIGATRSAGSGGGATVDHHTYFTLYRGINGASPTAIAQFSIHRLDNTAGEYEMVPSSVIRYLDVYPVPGDIRYYFTVTSDNGVTLNWLEPSIMIVRET